MGAVMPVGPKLAIGFAKVATLPAITLDDRPRHWGIFLMGKSTPNVPISKITEPLP